MEEENDDLQPIDEPKPQGRDTTGSQVLVGVLSAVAAAIVIALTSHFFLSEKSEIINTLRDELRMTRTDLLEEIRLDRESRVKLCIALREAGVNIPINILFSYIDSSGESEHLAEQFASHLPYVDGPIEFLKITEILPEAQRVRVIYRNLADGSAIVGFPGINWAQDRDEAVTAAGTVRLVFGGDESGAPVSVDGYQHQSLRGFFQEKDLLASTVFRVPGVEPGTVENM